MVHNWTDEWVKYLDIIAHFDISHDAPHWQTTTRSMCEAQTLTNKQDHCVSALDTKKQSEPLWVFNMLKGKRVPYIPKNSGTRKNSTLDPEVQKILEWLSFHWADYFAEPQNSDRQQPSSSSSSWSPSPTWWSFVILGPSMARMALSSVARQRVVGQKERTTTTDSRSE